MMHELVPVTHWINFRRPSHVVHWLKATHLIMRCSVIRTGEWVKVEQLNREGHLAVLFGALEEKGLHLTGRQKRQLVKDYEND